MNKHIILLLIIASIALPVSSQLEILSQHEVSASATKFISNWEHVGDKYLSISNVGDVRIHNDKMIFEEELDFRDMIDVKKMNYLSNMISDKNELIIFYDVFNKKKSISNVFSVKYSLSNKQLAEPKLIASYPLLYKRQRFYTTVYQSDDRSKIAMSYSYFDKGVSMDSLKSKDPVQPKFKVIIFNSELEKISDAVNYTKYYKNYYTETQSFISNKGEFYNLSVKTIENVVDSEFKLLNSLGSVRNVKITFEYIDKEGKRLFDVDIDNYLRSRMDIKTGANPSFTLITINEYDSPFIFEVFEVDYSSNKLSNIGRVVSLVNVDYSMRNYCENNKKFGHKFNQLKLYQTTTKYYFQFREAIYDYVSETPEVFDGKAYMKYKAINYGDIQVIEIDKVSLKGKQYSIEAFNYYKVLSQGLKETYLNNNYHNEEMLVNDVPIEFLYCEEIKELEKTIYSDSHRANTLIKTTNTPSTRSLQVIPISEDYEASFIIKYKQTKSIKEYPVNVSRVFDLGKAEFIYVYKYHTGPSFVPDKFNYVKIKLDLNM
jgi:hypothetical protein